MLHLNFGLVYQCQTVENFSVWMLSSLNQRWLCNFPSWRSLKCLSCYFVVRTCVCIYVRVWQNPSGRSTVPPQYRRWLNLPQGGTVGGWPLGVCQGERERGRESIISTSHTRPAALLTHQWLWPCPSAHCSLLRWRALHSLFPFSLSFCIYYYCTTLRMILPNELCRFSWTLSKSCGFFVVRTGKGFCQCTGSFAVARRSAGAAIAKRVFGCFFRFVPLNVDARMLFSKLNNTTVLFWHDWWIVIWNSSAFALWLLCGCLHECLAIQNR